VTQEFTTDRGRALSSLRIVHGNQESAPFSLYEERLDVSRRFDSQPAGHRIVLLRSDGLDLSRGSRSASPGQSVDLDRAIRGSAATWHRRVFVLFYFKELNDVLGREWIITYRTANTSSGFRRIYGHDGVECASHLHYPAVYDSGR
jgi:hypothetical protein